MNEFQRMLAFLKVLQCNLAVLHHGVSGEGWFEVHGYLDDVQEKLAELTDDLIEAGIALGFTEPTIADAILLFQRDVLPAVKRERKETYSITREAFRSTAGLMQSAEGIVPASVANRLQECEYWLNKEADYKLAGALGSGGERHDDDD
ncbi:MULTISPECIES: hypothetical protein [Holdemania]|uniref:hypothetical protein n=1 Tax=Holdemania TaxID=61170 RepID=UPI0018972967|nr:MULTISPECIES: hypothetical protein [Holdemania]